MGRLMGYSPATRPSRLPRPSTFWRMTRKMCTQPTRTKSLEAAGCEIAVLPRLGSRLGLAKLGYLTPAARYRWDDDDVAEGRSQVPFAEGVQLFNSGDYYGCHDVLEGLWNEASEPQRTILHGILQCAVALYHLLNQNHRGAMVELGEGLNKLRRMQFTGGPLREFEQEASAVLDFLYSTQLENAACGDTTCVTMDGSELSYSLLGNFGAGRPLYRLQLDEDGVPEHIQFHPERLANTDDSLAAPAVVKVKLPRLHASDEDLYRGF